MGFYSPHALLQAASKDGVEVLPLSLNFSEWDHTLEKDQRGEWGIRLGLRLINGLSEKGAMALVELRRRTGKWKNFE